MVYQFGGTNFFASVLGNFDKIAICRPLDNIVENPCASKSVGSSSRLAVVACAFERDVCEPSACQQQATRDQGMQRSPGIQTSL